VAFFVVVYKNNASSPLQKPTPADCRLNVGALGVNSTTQANKLGAWFLVCVGRI